MANETERALGLGATLLCIVVSASALQSETPTRLELLPADFCETLFDLEEPHFGSKEPVYQFLEMEFEGRTQALKLPRNYLEDGWDFNQGYTVPSHGFRVDMQGFSPIYSRDRRKFWDEYGYRDTSFIIGDIDTLARVLEIAVDVWQPRPEVFGGLTEKYRDDLGLTLIEAVNPPIQHKEVYYNSNRAAPSDVLQCGRVGDGVLQSCQHYFELDGINVDASYDREYLPQWKTIKSNISTFVGCLINFED